MPHFAVIKEERLTTNVRAIFDGSAENGDGISLHSQLLEGLALQQDIAALQILLHMRQYVIIGGISRMFYNPYLQSQFRDYYCFLWSFETYTDEPKVYLFWSITERFTIISNDTLRHYLHHLDQSNPEKTEFWT